MRKRYSKAQENRAEGIVNDIAEGIDRGESRAVLRESLSVYADKLTEAGIREQRLKDAKMEEFRVALEERISGLGPPSTGGPFSLAS